MSRDESGAKTGGWSEWVARRCDAIERAGRLRTLRPFESLGPVRARSEGRDLVLFSTNDYLGLSQYPTVLDAMARAVDSFGTGPRGSALVCGYTDLHAELEERLAALKETPASLLFPTGYAANVATLTAFAGPGTTIFSDSLNHASIIDGCRLANKNGARLVVYDHCDVDALETALRADDSERRLIVTDTVFSMDGDIAPLREFAALRERYGALLVVDEAHGTLVFGASGGGVADQLGVADAVDVHVGTLSKAFGCHGGFVATSEVFRTLLLNAGRPYVFSTALPMPLVAGAIAALDAAANGELRRRLWGLVEHLGDRLGRDLSSPIVPVVLGAEERTMRVAGALRAGGFAVGAIRPPTVPENSSRLRIALSAAHEKSDVDDLCEALDAAIT